MALILAVAAAMSAVTRSAAPPSTCPAGSVVMTVGETSLCTHGPDGGSDIDTAGLGARSPGSESTAVRAIHCSGNGTSGARVQPVYARVAGRPDRYTPLLPAMTTAAGEAEHIVDRSAAQTGGERHIRWETTGPVTDCRLNVVRVTVPLRASTDFGTLAASLAAQGLDRHDRKYLVWLDAAGTTCDGIATFLNDDRPGQENYNNTSVGYARVADDCLRLPGQIETHELLHTFGAVQSSAPNVSGGGHCSDEWDLLCYDDDQSGPFHTTVRCPSTAGDRRLDCHDDDYFSTSPPAGSYLATRWNAANSRYLDREAPVPSPVPPDPPANDGFATAPLLPGYTGSTTGTLAGATLEADEPVTSTTTGGSIWFKWRPRVNGPVAIDTRGSAADTVLAVSTGSEPVALVPVGANDNAAGLGSQSRVGFDAVSGTTYRVAVSGRADPAVLGTSGQAVTLRWGPPPGGFSDVAVGARYETAVAWSKAAGVIAGFADGTWQPRKLVTRGQAVAMLWHLRDEPAGATPHPFTDVASGAPYRAALDWAAGSGVVAITVPATLRPRDPLTRSQLADWLWATVGRPAYAGATPTFPDVVASEAIRWAVDHELLAAAAADGTFGPDRTVTRAQVAKALLALASDRAAWSAVAPPLPSTVVF